MLLVCWRRDLRGKHAAPDTGCDPSCFCPRHRLLVAECVIQYSTVQGYLSLSLSFFPNILLLFFLLSVYSFLQYIFIYHHLKKKNSLLFRMAHSKVIYGMLYIAKSHFDPCFAPFELDTGIDTTIYISTLDSHTRSPFGVAIKSTMNIRKVYRSSKRATRGKAGIELGALLSHTQRRIASSKSLARIMVEHA